MPQASYITKAGKLARKPIELIAIEAEADAAYESAAQTVISAQDEAEIKALRALIKRTLQDFEALRHSH